MIPEVKKEQLNWIRSNKVLALIIVLIGYAGYLTQHSFTQYEKQHIEDRQQINDYKEIVRLFQEGDFRAEEVEKASRILRKNPQ